jgi:arabinosyltransferase A
VLEPVQQLIGSQTPVLLDIATAANFPCQRPFSEHLGVAELPQYRIMPDHKQTATSSQLWEPARAGGPLLFTDALLGGYTVPSYLRNDWYRDWGTIERYDPYVPASRAPNAVIDQGSVNVKGWTRVGPIRALP